MLLQEKEIEHTPWQSSWLHRPSPEGKAQGRLCGRWVWEAVIEKRRSAKQVHSNFFEL